MRAAVAAGIVCLALAGRPAAHCLTTAQSAKISNILTGNITGDVVPSTYPVVKLNQSANNDSTFYGVYRDELEDLENEALALMARQRKTFEALRRKADRQHPLFDDLAMGAQRQ